MKVALTQAAPDGERCFITRHRKPLRCGHLIACSIDTEKQRLLEAAWGMKSGEFDSHALQNIFWLKVDMHTMFDRYTWLILPAEKDLKKVIDFNHRRASKHAPSHFLTALPGKTWEYHFLSLGYEDPIVRFGDDPKSYTVHESPYTSLSPLRSHLHPFYVIYNVGEKVHNIKDPEWNLDGHYKLPEDPSYRPLLEQCEALYLSWVGPSLLETSESSTQQSDFDQSSTPTFYRANVDNWLTGIQLCAPCEDPHFGGTEQAEQLLVKYKHEEAREPPRGT
ncbi:hypothetical protein RSOLAG22IIIB_04574 [Rhizoctonia solani]|uniref:HNH nuclease domain-containing protein n=1 Tax=Rhizoctonia solani TaxID=456999 RepID=A0A0K6FZ12_9AGAM|nr:hypothetical protein RSOLAG22IIIB_04574 [Rhizoctonia solani]